MFTNYKDYHIHNTTITGYSEPHREMDMQINTQKEYNARAIEDLDEKTQLSS